MISVETGISPNELLEAPDGILEAIVVYIKEKNKDADR
jgi:hypothetical protein|tara:strand:- start:1333 stop:1446 length:114 start_codon:yes stop_codon:yes gene_type:complete